jgi:hypothetical protein
VLKAKVNVSIAWASSDAVAILLSYGVYFHVNYLYQVDLLFLLNAKMTSGNVEFLTAKDPI